MVRMSTSSSSSSKKVSDPSNMDKGRRGWNWTAVVTSDPDGGLALKKQVNRHPRANTSGDKVRGWRPWEVTSEHSASIS